MSDYRAEIFISYSWADELVAKTIYNHLKEKVNLHLDKLDIGKWKSIKEYMQSIPKMDYTILLISDAYLKSSNCMYEVLEVLRDRNYKDKIFPVVINKAIYNPKTRAEYVKYWQNQYADLNESLQGIDIQNIGRLGDDLKQRQDISSNIANFLDMVSDMNNPATDDVSFVIEQKLSENGLIQNSQLNLNTCLAETDWFSTIGIPKPQKQITELETNQFLVRSFEEIISILKKLCEQLNSENNKYCVVTNLIDSRNHSFQFYSDGKLMTGFRISLDNSFGTMSIGLSNTMYSLGFTHSWNGIYTPKVINGNLILFALMSPFGSDQGMTSEDVVKDIWMNHIKPYIA